MDSLATTETIVASDRFIPGEPVGRGVDEPSAGVPPSSGASVLTATPRRGGRVLGLVLALEALRVAPVLLRSHKVGASPRLSALT